MGDNPYTWILHSSFLVLHYTDKHMRFSSACRHLNHDGLTTLERLSNPLHHVELIIVKLYLIHVDNVTTY